MAISPPIQEGKRRKWIRCKKCGSIYFYDYTPYGLSSAPVILPCCNIRLGNGAGFDQVESLDEATALAKIQQRLEYLRGELQAERISLDEIFELRSLVPYIDPNDIELLEAAGVPEQHH